jgi:O-antigen/teichoic acid export membrane protein
MLRSLVRDTALYGATDFVFRGLAYAMFPLYANLLSVAQFGILELLLTTLALFGIIANQGLNTAVSRYYYDADTVDTRRPAYIVAGLALVIFFSLIVTIAAALIAHLAAGEIQSRYAIAPVLAMLAIASVLPTQIVQYAQDMLRLRFEGFRFVLLSALRSMVALCVTVVLLVMMGWGVAGVLTGIVVGALTALPLAIWCLRRDLRVAPTKIDAWRLLSFGHGFVYMGLAYWVFGSMDRWILAELSDLENVGLYSIAFKIATIISFITTAFAQAWIPHAMKIHGEHAEARKIFGQMLLLWTALMAAVALLLGLFSREILMLLTPASFWPASVAAAFSIASAAALGTTQVTALGISFARRTGIFVALSWGTAALNFALNLLFVPIAGATGAAVGSFVAAVTLSGLYFYWTQRLYKMEVDIARVAVCAGILCGAPVLSFCIDRVDTSDSLRVGAKIIIVVLFAALAFYYGLLKREAFANLLPRQSAT